MLDTAAGIIYAAIIVEGVITYIKTFFVKGAFQWQMLVSIFFGIFVAIVYHLDLLALCGLNSSIPFVGQILTGILLSRGANSISDLIRAFQSLTDKTKLS